MSANQQMQRQLKKAKKFSAILTDTKWERIKSERNVKLLSFLALVPLPLAALWYVVEGRGRFMSWWYFSEAAFPLGTLMLAISVIAGFLLSRSVRRITTLPVSFLDERERDLRGKAYFSTYKQLSAIVVGFLALIAVHGLLKDFGLIQALEVSIYENYSVAGESGGAITEQGQWLLGLLNPFGSGFGNAFVFGGIFFFLLWVLPIIKIAKLEAKSAKQA